MACILDLLAAGQLNFDAVTTNVVPFDDAVAVYEKINSGELQGLGVVFHYPLQGSAVKPQRRPRPQRPGRCACGLCHPIGFASA